MRRKRTKGKNEVRKGSGGENKREDSEKIKNERGKMRTKRGRQSESMQREWKGEEALVPDMPRSRNQNASHMSRRHNYFKRIIQSAK